MAFGLLLILGTSVRFPTGLLCAASLLTGSDVGKAGAFWGSARAPGGVLLNDRDRWRRAGPAELCRSRRARTKPTVPLTHPNQVSKCRYLPVGERSVLP